MTPTNFDQVCYRTEQRDEQVVLQNVKSGERGFSVGCTCSGETVQVKLENGELDSWSREECREYA